MDSDGLPRTEREGSAPGEPEGSAAGERGGSAAGERGGSAAGERGGSAAGEQGGSPRPGPERFREGEILDLTIDDLAYGGAGVARIDGFVCFVRGALPGEVVRARIQVRRPTFAEAEAIETMQASPHRIPAPCAHFGACGGCQWMSLAYETQLRHKQRQVIDCLTRIGRIEGFTLHPIAPSPETFAYRNKMEFAFAQGPRGLYAGLHRTDDPAVIEEIHECHIQDPAANRVLRWTIETCREMGLTADDRGLLRRLVLRKGHRDGKYLVAFVTGPGPFPEGRSLGRRMMETFTEIAGVVRIIGDSRGSFGTSEGLEGRNEPLAGEATIREEIDGLILTVTAGAFLQVNSGQAVRLYNRVEEFAAVDSREGVLDLYCGAGAITLWLGRRASRATGVESSLESVRCAEGNARDNGLGTCRFIRGDARRASAQLLSRGNRYDIVVLNPPRAGLQKEVIEAVSRFSAGRLVYVSCNPATLARDLARFARLGYRTTDIAPFDMFPHTYHIETVARLQRSS